MLQLWVLEEIEQKTVGVIWNYRKSGSKSETLRNAGRVIPLFCCFIGC
jgi:hypothetical protein